MCDASTGEVFPAGERNLISSNSFVCKKQKASPPPTIQPLLQYSDSINYLLRSIDTMSDNTKKGWANKPTPEEYMTIATKPSPSEMQISSPPSPSEMKIEAKPSPSESTPPSTPPSKRVKLSPIIEVTAPNLKRGRTTSSALIIENARHSPGSSRRNAMSQLYRCDMTAKELMWSFPTIKFSTLRVVNMASHHSRYEGYVTSEAFEKLQEQVRAHKDSFDVIIVLFTDVLRIGAKVEHVTRLQAELAKISDKASVLTIKEAGKDLEAAGKIVQVWLKKRSDVGEDSSHVDGGKSLPRSAHGEQLNTNIKARRKELNDQTNSSGSLAPRIAAAVEIGKKFQCPTDPLTKDVYKAMVKDVDVDGSDENVAKIADQWKNHALQYETWVAGLSEKDVENLAYLRTTDSEDELSDFDDEGEVNGRHYKNGIPVHQSNGVVT